MPARAEAHGTRYASLKYLCSDSELFSNMKGIVKSVGNMKLRLLELFYSSTTT